MFTSGSTGQPKGVLVTHSGVINRLLWGQEKFSLTTKDKMLHRTPFTFDLSVPEIFSPLIAGAQLYLLSRSFKKI